MECLQAGVIMLVCGLLPLGGGGITEEYPTSHGADRVDPADFAGLKGTAAGNGRLGWDGLVIRQLGGKSGEFGGGNIEPVAVFVEMAAAAGHDTQGPALIDLQLQVGVERANLRSYFRAERCGENRLFQIV